MRIGDWSSDVCSSDLRWYLPGRFPLDRALLADDAGVAVGELSASASRRVCGATAGANRDVRFAMFKPSRLQVCNLSNHQGGVSARLQPLGQPCRSEEHTSELQSLMRISYAVFCLKKK